MGVEMGLGTPLLPRPKDSSHAASQLAELCPREGSVSQTWNRGLEVNGEITVQPQ